MSTLREKTYQTRLDALKRAITRKARTAGELAELLSATKPTIYAQLEELQKRGARLTLNSVRRGARGPQATTFILTA